MLVASPLILGYDATVSSNTRLYDPILYNFLTVLTCTVVNSVEWVRCGCGMGVVWLVGRPVGKN